MLSKSLWKEGLEVGREWPERECSARRERAQRAPRGGAGSGIPPGGGEATLTLGTKHQGVALLLNLYPFVSVERGFAVP